MPIHLDGLGHGSMLREQVIFHSKTIPHYNGLLLNTRLRSYLTFKLKFWSG